jgi:hypothetical protein
MLPEYYLGAAVAVILLVLLAALLRHRRATQQVLDKSGGTEQLASQLSRIADALETLVAHLGASSPRVEQPSTPLQKPSEPSVTNQEKSGEPKKQHVSLSMFGR